MTDTTVIDRLAQAGEKAHDEYLRKVDEAEGIVRAACAPYPFDAWSDAQKEEYRCIVRAVLAAARPTEADKGDDALFKGKVGDTVLLMDYDSWAAIDAWFDHIINEDSDAART